MVIKRVTGLLSELLMLESELTFSEHNAIRPLQEKKKTESTKFPTYNRYSNLISQNYGNDILYT